MKSKAAIAFSAGEPLSIEEVDLEGPKSGEVLIEVMATGVCHTDAYTLSGGDPSGLFPDTWPRRRWDCKGGRRWGRYLQAGDHVIPLYTPECRQCKFCLSGKN